MANIVIDILIEGGKATPAPPLGPTLSPLRVNIGKVVAEINSKTKQFAGMKVPVKISVDPGTKEFEIEVGLPPTSQLLLKESGIAKGSGAAGTESAGNMSLDSVIKVAKMKTSTLSKELKDTVKEVLGTCVSLGLTVDNKDPRDIQKEIDAGTVNIS